MPFPKNKRATGIALSAVALAALLGVAFVWPGRSGRINYSSSPTAIRPWAEPDFALDTAPIPSVGKATDAPYVSTVKLLLRHELSTDPNKFETRFVLDVNRAKSHFIPAYEVIPFNAKDGFKGKDFEIQVPWLGIKHGMKGLIAGNSAELDLFRTDLGPISDSTATAMGISQDQRTFWPSRDFVSQFRLPLQTSGLQDVQWRPRRIFDARTKMALSNTFSWMPKRDAPYFHYPLPIVHDASLLAVVDAFHGPVVTFDATFAEGTTAGDDRVLVELLALREGKTSNSTSTGSEGNGSMEVTLRGDMKTTASACTALFRIEPREARESVSIEALDHQGNVIPSESGMIMRDFRIREFAKARSAIAQFRCTFRPYNKRLLITIDHLPGVSSGNVGVTNLFDTVVPEIEFQNEETLRRFIESVTELQEVVPASSRGGLSARGGSFPMVFRNSTPRQMLESYLKQGPGRHVEINPADHTIQYRESRPVTWLAKAAQWVKMRWP